MSSFSIVDDSNLKYKLRFIPIFAISESSWNNLLKTKAFNISFEQSVLFTGNFSGFLITPGNVYVNTVEIKIRFNLHGGTNYTYEILKFPLQRQLFHQFLPINFVKTFTPGLYDVYIESAIFSSGSSYYDQTFFPDLQDFLNLNIHLYDLIIEEDNFEL